MTTSLSRTGMEPLLVHQTQTLTTEFTWWALSVVITTQPKHALLNSTQRSISHVLTKTMVQLNQTSSICSKTGTLHTQWRKFSLDSKTKWLQTRSFLNQLMVICTEELWSNSTPSEICNQAFAPFARYSIEAGRFKYTQAWCRSHSFARK